MIVSLISSYKKAMKNNPATKRIHWPQMILLLVLPFIAIYGFLTTQIQRKTAYFSIFYYIFSGLGITAGYHRLWSHKAYKAVWPYRLVMMLAGSSALQGSIKWWSRGHRAHHRYTDTDKDPYNAKRGMMWAHILWMFFKPERGVIGTVDIRDLEGDKLVQFQHRFYVPLSLVMVFLLPTIICGMWWGDWRGGYFIAGVLRVVLLQHATFCINSLAHYLGDQTYDDRLTPRDHAITAIVTLGEGYHNFHHEFPYDYRNGVRYYHFDPTKWLIAILRPFGVTRNLRRAPDDAITKGALLMIEKRARALRRTVDWGKSLSSLPLWTSEQLKEELKNRPNLVVLNGIVHDLEGFIHPGGDAIIRAYRGRDAKAAFEGGVYCHTTAARNIAAKLRIARLSYASCLNDTPSKPENLLLDKLGNHSPTSGCPVASDGSTLGAMPLSPN